MPGNVNNQKAIEPPSGSDRVLEAGSQANTPNVVVVAFFRCAHRITSVERDHAVEEVFSLDAIYCSFAVVVVRADVAQNTADTEVVVDVVIQVANNAIGLFARLGVV